MAEAGRPERVFRERKNPFEDFLSDVAFRQRYRLSRELVKNLSDEFGRSEFSTKGTKSSKGLSHAERVSINTCNKGKKLKEME